MKITLKLLLVLFSINSYAQDMIIKNDKTEMKTKVLEITEDAIKYKKFEMLDGPTYNINKADVFMIIYKNGNKEYIENKSSHNISGNSSSKQQGKNEINDSDLSFNAKSKGLFFGLGIGAAGFAASGGEVTIPPLQLRYEFAVSPTLSFGAIMAAAGSKYSYYDYSSYSTQPINQL